MVPKKQPQSLCKMAKDANNVKSSIWKKVLNKMSKHRMIMTFYMVKRERESKEWNNFPSFRFYENILQLACQKYIYYGPIIICFSHVVCLSARYVCKVLNAQESCKSQPQRYVEHCIRSRFLCCFDALSGWNKL